jgi:hypothetical protein
VTVSPGVLSFGSVTINAGGVTNELKPTSVPANS